MRAAIKLKRRLAGAGFVAPFGLLFLAFAVAPLVYAAYLSCFRRTLAGTETFVGLANYGQIIGDGAFWGSVGRVLLFGVIEVPVVVVIATLAAVLLDMKLIAGARVFRLLFFIPFAVPAVIAAIMWSDLLSQNLSPIDAMLASSGLPAVNFLGPNLIWVTMGLIVLWESLGYNMLIVYTALQAIPAELTEAAVLDGAGVGALIRSVRIPMVRRSITLSALFSVIGMLQLFTEPQIMSTITTSVTTNFTPNFFLYTTAFSGEEFELAAAGAFLLAVIIIALVAAGFMASRLVASRRESRQEVAVARVPALASQAGAGEAA
jgi:multiple sugar transport system permease protein